MATIYMDPENGSDSLNGQSILRLTGCAVTNNSTTLTVPLNTVGITAGMIVLSLDMNNSGGLIAYGTTVSSITGNSVTLNKVAIGTSSNATIVFSSAIKTLNGIGSKVAAGDTVRIKKSPDALSVGQNVTWTLGSQSVTLATPVNVTLDNCDSMWSNGASIPGQYVYTYGLSSAPATNAQHVKWTILQATDSVAQGNNSLYFAIRSYVGASTTSAAYSAFKTATDGTYTVFYKDLGQTIDLTNYQQISMWCANSFTTGNVGTMKLCLCSDAYGAVVENSFTIPNRGWGALVFDNGAPLSSKVRSISIRIENRVGPAYANGYEFDTIGLRLDNVVVSKAKGAADEITHLTLIGKNPDLSNTEQWYSVRSIESGKINIDHWNKSGPSTVPGYYNGTGVSESGPLYKRECFYLNTAGVNTPQPSRTANAGTTPSGLPDQVITISGGWDATNMSSQTGMSFFDDNQTAYYFAVGAYNVVEKLGFYRNGYSDVNYGVTLVNGNGTEIKDCYFGNNYCGLAVAAGVRGTALTRLRGNNTLANYVYLRAYSYGTKLDRCEFVGSEASGVYLESMYTSNSNYDGADKITIINSNLSVMQDNAIQFSGSLQTDTTIAYTRMQNVGLPVLQKVRGTVKVKDCLYDSSSPVSFEATACNKVQFHNVNQVPGDHRTVFDDGYAQFSSEMTTNRRTQSGLAWALKPLDTYYVNSQSPLRVPVAQVFVESGKTITASLYMRKTITNLVCGLVMREGQLVGQAKVQTLHSAAAGTWQQVSISFVAPASGVVEIEAFAYGTSIGVVHIDDFTMTSTG